MMPQGLARDPSLPICVYAYFRMSRDLVLLCGFEHPVVLERKRAVLAANRVYLRSLLQRDGLFLQPENLTK